MLEVGILQYKIELGLWVNRAFVYAMPTLVSQFKFFLSVSEYSGIS